MKLKEKFILHSNVNKAPPKQEKSIDTFSLIYEKIPSSFLKENPTIGQAANRKRKPFITIIKKYKKPEFIGLNNIMEDNERKVISEINDLKEIIYDHYKEKDRQMNNYGKIKNENNIFSKIYNKIRKEKNKFGTGTYLDYEPFISISNKYISKNMKIPKFSLDHNIFSGNPLILEGSELEDYIIYNLGNKDKSIQFLNKIDDLVNRKKMGNFKVSTQEMENIRKNEKTKGYIPPSIEINKLKNDIKSTRSSCKDLDGFDEFFDSLKTRKKIIEKYSLYRTKSSSNLFNSIGRNYINNSNNNLENNNNNTNNSIVNIKNRRRFSLVYQYKKLALNNSDITATTGINFSRNPSSLETFRELNFHSNGYNTLSRQHKTKKITLSPIKSPFLFSSKNIEFHKIHKKFSHNNVISRNNFNSVHHKSTLLNSPKIKRLENQRRYKTKKLTLHELNKKENMFELSEGDKNLTHYSENNAPIQINKEMKDITNRRENKRKLKFKNEVTIYGKHLHLDIGTEVINIKGREKKQNINILKDKKEKEKEKKVNEIENLFEIAKSEEINFKDKKKEIENYAISKGKDLNNLLSKKDTYFSIYRLKKKTLEKNFIIDKLIQGRGSKIKLPNLKKEKIYLAKNKSFLDGIINQEKKLKEVIMEDKFQ